jgi:hypothetical protein
MPSASPEQPAGDVPEPAQPDKSAALVTLRAAVGLLLSVLAAAAAASPTWLYQHNAAEAALIGLVALAGGAKFFDWLIA